MLLRQKLVKINYIGIIKSVASTNYFLVNFHQVSIEKYQDILTNSEEVVPITFPRGTLRYLLLSGEAMLSNLPKSL